MAEIALEQLSKVYGDGTHAVADLNLHVEDGEFVVLVGPSGCGKTTALRMVAGLEEITGGTVRIGERIVNKLPPKDRDLAMVFQNYALYPHMSAYDNMAFGLKMRSFPKAEIRRRVQDAARVLGLEPVLKKRPRTLSGGQRQRVAMGRAIVREPQAFLMDEPLSSLDAHPALAPFEGRRVILGVRPEDLEDAAVAGAEDGRTIASVVDIREDLGAEVLVHFGIAGPPVRGEDVQAAVGAEALEATSETTRQRGALFTARVARESRAREGEKIELAVNSSR